MDHVSENVKHAADAISVTAVIGTLTAWLPPIAAALSIIWYLLRIYDWWVENNKRSKEKE